jgi:DNA-binding protein H-NS
VPIKYRDKAGNTWAGRGAQPRWLTAAIKAGAKRDDFLVDKSAAKKTRKKTRRKK